MRPKLKLQEFDYVIVYRKGTDNRNSDGLSRMYTSAEEFVVGDVQESNGGMPRGNKWK
jgi:hypothetical protein